MAFSENDRIVVIEKGQYEGKHGSIIEIIPPIMFPGAREMYEVELESEGKRRFFYSDIKHEDLRFSQIPQIRNLDSVSSKLAKIFTKLPEDMQRELHIHIGYLKVFLLSHKYSRSRIERDYVKNNIHLLMEENNLRSDLESILSDFEEIDKFIEPVS